MPITKRNTYKANVAGREVLVYAATQTQIAFIGRYTKHATKALENDDIQKAMFAIGDVLDILDSLVVEQKDKDDLAQLMMTGQLEASEFITAWSDAMPEAAPENGPTSKVSRGKVSR